jgi:hypothetical protein
VETPDYRQWIVETRSIDCGGRYDVMGNGSRTPEDHPAVLNCLTERLAFLRKERRETSLEHYRISEICHLRWVLSRNGHDTAEAEDPETRQAEEECLSGILTPVDTRILAGFKPPPPPADHDDAPP